MNNQEKPLSEIIRTNIKKYRKIAKISQKELGIMLKYEPSQAQQRIYQYESGSRSPNKETISMIANALRVSVEAIITENYEDKMVEMFKKAISRKNQHIA